MPTALFSLKKCGQGPASSKFLLCFLFGHAAARHSRKARLATCPFAIPKIASLNATHAVPLTKSRKWQHFIWFSNVLASSWTESFQMFSRPVARTDLLQILWKRLWFAPSFSNMPHAKTWRAQAFGPAFILSNWFGVAQRFTDQWPWDGPGMALGWPWISLPDLPKAASVLQSASLSTKSIQISQTASLLDMCKGGSPRLIWLLISL